MRRLIIVLLTILLLGSHPATANHSDQPESVAIAGTFQAALGCAGDWNTDCDLTYLTFDETHQLWIGEFDLPAGEHEYKVALNGTWDENYGNAAEQDGANIKLSLDADTTVTFLYNHKTHTVTDDVNRIIANVPGSFNSEVGCPDTSFDDPANVGDWAPDCWQTLLEDADGDGIYTFATTALPAGNYEGKVAVGGNWSENYGDLGAPSGANIGFTVPKDNAEVLFSWDSVSKVLTISAEGAPKGNLAEASAYWVSRDTILTRLEPENTYQLHTSPTASLQITETSLQGGTVYDLTIADEIDATITAKFPHLAQLTALRLPDEVVAQASDILRGQFALGVTDPAGNIVTATGLQIPGVLDELYSYDGTLGVVWDGDVPSLHLWAPTAQSVILHLVPDPDPLTPSTPIEMTRDDATGVWSATGDAEWRNQYYLYEVNVYSPEEGAIARNFVTDPYSVGLSTNSTRSQIVDLSDPTWQPDGWDAVAKPELAAPEDIVLYELHIRDFSIYDKSVPENERGTYLAFTHPDAAGMTHLANLAQAGLTHIHLLPTFDIATINENKDEQRSVLQRFLEGFESTSPQQQQAIFNLRDEDGFNWGYDPFHYTVPEGSYATDNRTIEFRQMVQALNEAGLRVVMDVVYNHTNASGQAEKSVLDRVVPGYYHRLNSKGKVENSTCCANTATEHDMMQKLMIDSVLTWATAYKVDGFRFDLMGHHMVEDMRAVREALDGLTLEEHGVDGSSIYVYGEGWDFGEVVNGVRGENATQLNVGGLGIGTFNDRLRDAVRGGNPFGGEQEQGFATGLLNDPNATNQEPESAQRARLMLFADQIRVGLAGNLANYEFVSMTDVLVRGAEVDYNGMPAGYTLDPEEHIVYVSAHDNETLFDAIQYKAADSADLNTRVQMQNLALDIVMLSQGVPFFHAGSDMLRSKSFDRDSYNSGDWFNALDWTYNSNNWGRGLPVADKNEGKWEIMEPLLGDPDLVATQEHILTNVNHFQWMLRVRQSSPLFRLRSAEDVQERVNFHNTGRDQIAGLIVMSIDDTIGADLDPNYERVVVLFNATAAEQTFTIDSLQGAEMSLHPELALLSDSRIMGSSPAPGTFTVPARTTAVFVEFDPEPANTDVPEEIDASEQIDEPLSSYEQPPSSPQPSPLWAILAGAGVLALVGGGYAVLSGMRKEG